MSQVDVQHSVSLPRSVGSVPGLPLRERCLVMGIVNVTPDSFSDGGSWAQAEEAVRHGLALLGQGADLLDVGGESTRPGADRVPEAEELRRVLPVVRELAAAGALVSIDTSRARVARAALEVGAVAVNDVSGGLADPRMTQVVAEARVPFFAMHWRAPSAVMRAYAHYDDVVEDVVRELGRRVEALVDDGVDPRQVVLDPGLGFAKDPHHDWELLSRLPELMALGRPILVGASRKSFLGAALVGDRSAAAQPLAPRERDAATAAVSALAAADGAFCVRVHDVPATLDAVRVADAYSRRRRGWSGP